jgi:prepilin-type N-terminal cleavage/methylation domain-containing protein
MVAKDKGFTLVEVLMAMMVFSLALLELGRMQLVATQVNTVAGRLTQGTTLAQDRVERLMTLPYDDPQLADTTAVGTFTSYTDPNPPQGYTIRWEVDTNAPTAGVKTINIFVTWTNLKAAKTFTLSVHKSNV